MQATRLPLQLWSVELRDGYLADEHPGHDSRGLAELAPRLLAATTRRYYSLARALF